MLKKKIEQFCTEWTQMTLSWRRLDYFMETTGLFEPPLLSTSSLRSGVADFPAVN
jgi:hypothetical protein